MGIVGSELQPSRLLWRCSCWLLVQLRRQFGRALRKPRKRVATLLKLRKRVAARVRAAGTCLERNLRGQLVQPSLPRLSRAAAKSSLK